MGLFSIVKTALGNVSGPTGVATWVVAGAAYLGYQSWRQQQAAAAGGGFTDAERDAFNDARKKETAAAAAAVEAKSR